MQPPQITSFLWSVADLIRDTFKRGKYQDVILPLTVLRRLDCVLAPTKPAVLEALADAPNLKDNLLHYIHGFSPNMREVIERFDFYNTIGKLDEAGLLFQVMERFKTGRLALAWEQQSQLSAGSALASWVRESSWQEASGAA